jgi:hypothetical protein
MGFEPMPWELVRARQSSAPTAMPFAPRHLSCPMLQTRQADAFAMQSLHEALPDPMCLEVTLAPPTTPSHWLPNSIKTIAKSPSSAMLPLGQTPLHLCLVTTYHCWALTVRSGSQKIPFTPMMVLRRSTQK